MRARAGRSGDENLPLHSELEFLDADDGDADTLYGRRDALSPAARAHVQLDEPKRVGQSRILGAIGHVELALGDDDDPASVFAREHAHVEDLLAGASSDLGEAFVPGPQLGEQRIGAFFFEDLLKLRRFLVRRPLLDGQPQVRLSVRTHPVGRDEGRRIDFLGGCGIGHAQDRCGYEPRADEPHTLVHRAENIPGMRSRKPHALWRSAYLGPTRAAWYARSIFCFVCSRKVC